MQRQLGLSDLVLARVLCMVGTSWVELGRARMLFWLGAMLALYLPIAPSIGLNREMPLEDGLYAWAHRAFGDLVGFLTAWNTGVCIPTTGIFYLESADLFD